MATYTLNCRLGNDPSDGADTYLVTLHDDTGELVGASGYNQNPATDYLCSEGEVFASYLAQGADVYIGALNQRARDLAATFEDLPVQWSIDIEGDWGDNTDADEPQAVS
jgi:hypothetical protein